MKNRTHREVCDKTGEFNNLILQPNNLVHIKRQTSDNMRPARLKRGHNEVALNNGIKVTNMFFWSFWYNLGIYYSSIIYNNILIIIDDTI